MAKYFTVDDIAEQHQFNKATLLQFMETFRDELKPFIQIRSGKKWVHPEGIQILNKIKEMYQVLPSLSEIKEKIKDFLENRSEKIKPLSQKKKRKKKKSNETETGIQTAVDQVLVEFQKKYINKLEEDVSYFKKTHDEIRMQSFEERKRSDYLMAQMQQAQKLLTTKYEKKLKPPTYKKWSNKWIISQMATMFSLMVIPK